MLSLTAQAETPGATGVKAKIDKKCLFPKSKKRAPDWVCNANADGVKRAALGSAAKSKAGLAFMEEMAAADARTRLAQKQASGLTEAELRGSKILKKIYAPDGTLYVLVGFEEAVPK